MTCGRHGERPNPGISAVEADDLPERRDFPAGCVATTTWCRPAC
jgi:hypothetical protein